MYQNEPKYVCILNFRQYNKPKKKGSRKPKIKAKIRQGTAVPYLATTVPFCGSPHQHKYIRIATFHKGTAVPLPRHDRANWGICPVREYCSSSCHFGERSSRHDRAIGGHDRALGQKVINRDLWLPNSRPLTTKLIRASFLLILAVIL